MVAPKKRSTRSGLSPEDRRAQEEAAARRAEEEERARAAAVAEPESEEEEEEEFVGDFLNKRETHWDGPPVKRRPNGDSYYLAFILNGVRYAIGECVVLSLGGDQTKEEDQVIARIDNVWEDGAGVKWTELLWFYLPRELHTGRLPTHHEREVFDSNLSDENEIDCVVTKCKVVTYDEFQKLSQEEIERDNVYCCRYHYNPVKKSFAPYIPRSTSVQGKKKTRGTKMTDRLLAYSGPPEQHAQAQQPALPPALQHRGSQDKNVPAGDANARPSVLGKQAKFEVASHALQLSTVPDALPCREKEQEELRSVISQAITDGHSGGCIYISGVPGTGKTASVHAVIRELRAKAEEGQLPTFQYIEINGQRLPEPSSLYSVLLQGLTGRKAAGTLAAQQLDAFFGSKQSARQDCCVLLVDELDYLVTRKQTVLYNLFDWPSRPNSKLVVLGIANTMDLPERMLPRIASRLGLRRISFAPYTYQQLDQVIHSRLKQLDAFDSKAIELCSRKVAAVSGDVRKALQICRQACDNARTDGLETVSLSNIENAVKQLYTNPYVAAIKGISLLERIVVVAAAQALREGAMAHTDLTTITLNTVGNCRALGVTEPTHGQVAAACARLVDMRLLAHVNNHNLELCVQLDDVGYALKDDPVLKRVAGACAG